MQQKPPPQVTRGGSALARYRRIIVGGLTIGRGSVIGAGTVVTRPIPAYAIAMGVPARVVGSRGLHSNQALIGASPSTAKSVM